MISALLLSGAALLLAGPALWKARPVVLGPSDVPAKAPHLAPTYQSAIADLAHVRLRLVQTKALDDKTKAAIDALTLALVAGSDA
jgi:hypothetical protein